MPTYAELEIALHEGHGARRVVASLAMREVAPTLPAALRELARQCPHEPWLFHRPSWIWRWRSYVQVADQAARGADMLRQAGVDGAGRRVGCPPLVEPDAVAAALAVQSTGAAAVPSVGAAEDDWDAWAEVSPRTDGVELPSSRRRIDRWAPQDVDDRSEPAGAAFAGHGAVTHGELWQAGERWRLRLPSVTARPIVLTSPRLQPTLRHELMALTLASRAAWALEHDPEAFLAAALWCRPTVAAVTPAEAGELAAALAERRHRRWNRLRLLVVDGQTGATGEATWRELGVDILSFPADVVSSEPDKR